ncbi:DNA cytosine methyltransferase [Pedobacter frigidisoli]|uniref:Cytosine-specific methyltransferase n=1 Tax=Pedobacter frigidisoli TaxID=2530455 RepID=A0A4V2MMW5_9SPHI|nr:DNA cytosine methyltransferase [Pedobacter frigidisoli]TCD10391.1 DNA cytosine methyltransferase [Pedobacter frigidisoli]
MIKSENLTYLSLFSSAGIGCYGFKTEGFDCVATVELLSKRLKIQQNNDKCKFASGYISEDITTDNAKVKIREELAKWNIEANGKDLDVLIATPPCQGMSVANHKKGNELNRNSLVTESIRLTKEIKPKFFIFENVRAFLKTLCTDVDGLDIPIKEAIELNLAADYQISYQILNFKDFGCPSSRTRSLVIGVRKDLNKQPENFYPEKSPEQLLRTTIGHLPLLKTMGEIAENDIYHNFRNYRPEMQDWISAIGEGESAFDNKDSKRIPHKVIDGEIVINVNKNGDKYKRQYWDKVAPCIHTRNDILSSQNTVHPVDNRVFSIRELMLMMSVPENFNWLDQSFEDLNKLSTTEKKKILAKEELNIRHCLGEAVPTVIFQQIASKIKTALATKHTNNQNIILALDEINI